MSHTDKQIDSRRRRRKMARREDERPLSLGRGGRPAPLHQIEKLAENLEREMAEWAARIRRQMMCRVICGNTSESSWWTCPTRRCECHRPGERTSWRSSGWGAESTEKKLHAAEVSRATAARTTPS